MMQRVSFFMILILMIGTGSVYADEPKEKTEVEGTWKLVKGGRGAPTQLTFTGSKFTLTLAKDRVLKGTFKLNSKENPGEMDLTITADSGNRFQNKVTLCIYKFDVDKLVWCASIPGRKRRPPEFAEVMGDARLLLGTYEMARK